MYEHRDLIRGGAPHYRGPPPMATHRHVTGHCADDRDVGVRRGQEAASASSEPAYSIASLPVRRGQRPARPDDAAGEVGQMAQIEQSHVTDTTSACTSQRVQPARTPARAEDLRGPTTSARSWPAGPTSRIDTTGKAGPATPAWTGPTIQHHAELRDLALAAAHTGHLRRRCRSRLRPPLAGAAVPAVDRDGRHLGSVGRPAGGEVTANALRATGWNWDFAPVQDIARDNRGAGTTRPGPRAHPGRRPGRGDVRGLQSGGGRGLKVTATVKHFAGYSDRSTATTGSRPSAVRDLQDRSCRRTRARINACGHGHGGFRLDQRDSRDRVALPADHACCATGWASRAW